MHNCPQCGQACYCAGDIDDIDTGDEEALVNCVHCVAGESDIDSEETIFGASLRCACGANIGEGDSIIPNAPPCA